MDEDNDDMLSYNELLYYLDRINVVLLGRARIRSNAGDGIIGNNR